jgi:PKD repeat protein
MDTPNKAVTVTFNLKADFTGTPLSGANPLAVQFTDHSIAGASSWLWDFGDSTTSTLQNPDHVYATSAGYPANYTVSLTANGATTTKTNYVTLTSSCSSSPVLVGVTPYATIQNALDSALSLNDIIRVMAVGRSETLNWNQNIAIGLYGGYDCNFTTNSLGFTTVTGSMTIDSNAGTLTIENLTVK